MQKVTLKRIRLLLMIYQGLIWGSATGVYASLAGFIMYEEPLYFLIAGVAACNMLYWSLRVGDMTIESADQQRVLFVPQADGDRFGNDAEVADYPKKHAELQSVISDICGIYACLCWVEHFCQGEETPVVATRALWRYLSKERIASRHRCPWSGWFMIDPVKLDHFQYSDGSPYLVERVALLAWQIAGQQSCPFGQNNLSYSPVPSWVIAEQQRVVDAVIIGRCGIDSNRIAPELFDRQQMPENTL